MTHIWAKTLKEYSLGRYDYKCNLTPHYTQVTGVTSKAHILGENSIYKQDKGTLEYVQFFECS